jgi:hypothetical protein
MPEKEYLRLTRARSRSAFAVAFMSRSSLWLGKDHLLCIDSNGYTETYKRFYFRDIQVVTLAATLRRKVWNGVLLVPIVICLAGLATNLSTRPRADAATVMAWAIVTLVFVVPFLIHNLLGPTCICHLRTAVQIEELPSLNRLRRARKVLERIRPLISAVQGGLSPEEISLRMRVAVGTPGGATSGPSIPASPPPGGDHPEAPPVIS